MPAYTLPPDREDLAIQRILVRHDFSRDMAGLLLDDYHRSMKVLEKHGPKEPLTAEEGTSFHH